MEISRRTFLKGAASGTLLAIPIARNLLSLRDVQPAYAAPSGEQIHPETEIAYETVATAQELHERLRSHDRLVLGDRPLDTWTEAQIRAKRREAGRIESPFDQQIAMAQGVANNILNYGMQIVDGKPNLGTNDPIIWGAAHAALYRQMVSNIDLTGDDILSKVFYLPSAEVMKDQLLVLQSEHSIDPRSLLHPWRSHALTKADGTQTVVAETSAADQLLVLTGTHAADYFPLRAKPDGSIIPGYRAWITLQIGSQTYTIYADLGATHEWWGHLHGKGESRVGGLPDFYWATAYNLNTRLTPLSYQTSIRHVIPNARSIMTDHAFAELTPFDGAWNLIRGRYNSPWGGIHADGLPFLHLPNNSKEITDMYFAPNGYQVGFTDRNGIPITSDVLGDRAFKLSWLPNNPEPQPVEFNPRSKLQGERFILDGDLRPCQNIFFSSKQGNGILPSLSRFDLNLIGAASANNPDHQPVIDIHLNATHEQILSGQYRPEGSGGDTIYTHSAYGIMDEAAVGGHPDILGWFTFPVAGARETKWITAVWTNNRDVQIPTNNPSEMRLPIVSQSAQIGGSAPSQDVEPAASIIPTSAKPDTIRVLEVRPEASFTPEAIIERVKEQSERVMRGSPDEAPQVRYTR